MPSSSKDADGERLSLPNNGPSTRNIIADMAHKVGYNLVTTAQTSGLMSVDNKKIMFTLSCERT